MGNYDTYWHSGYNENRKDSPFCIIFDMKQTLWVGKIGIMQRRGGYNFRMTKMDIYTTTDATYKGKDENNWTLIATINPIPSNDMQWFAIDQSILKNHLSGRYLKVVVVDTWDHNGITGLAEFTVQRIK